MSGTSLPEVQRWMQDALRFPGGIGPDEIERQFAATGRFDAAAGLAVYQRGYILRIASCMREQFPALCHALGRGLFDDFVADYVRERPPESHTLYDLGRRFTDFLEESRPDRGATDREGWIDFMVDLARFERQVFALFDAPGHEGKALAGPATPDERLRLQPAFVLGAYNYPVHLYYHAVRRGEPAALPPAEPSFVALVRTDYVTRTIPLAEPHFVFLSTMTGGGVEDGLEAVARHLALPVDSVRRSWRDEAGVRSRWLDWGFFVARD
jgi:hypothetical protein